jgi:hypothetical protein
MVEIKGWGSLILVSIRPLIKPRRVPIARQLRSAIQGFILYLVAKSPMNMVERARIDPTERSMPEVRIARNIPTEMIELIAAWPATFIRLSTVKKRGETIERIIQSSKRLNTTPKVFKYSLTLFPFDLIAVAVISAIYVFLLKLKFDSFTLF